MSDFNTWTIAAARDALRKGDAVRSVIRFD